MSNKKITQYLSEIFIAGCIVALVWMIVYFVGGIPNQFGYTEKSNQKTVASTKEHTSYDDIMGETLKEHDIVFIEENKENYALEAIKRGGDFYLVGKTNDGDDFEEKLTTERQFLIVGDVYNNSEIIYE